MSRPTAQKQDKMVLFYERWQNSLSTDAMWGKKNHHQNNNNILFQTAFGKILSLTASIKAEINI